MTDTSTNPGETRNPIRSPDASPGTKLEAQSEPDARTADTESTSILANFLLIGSERSGSTMLRLMLDHHPRLACLYESDFMVVPYETSARDSVADYAQVLRSDWHFQNSGLTIPERAESYTEVIADFFRQRRSATGKELIGATIQHSFDVVPKLFPRAKLVHLIRDGRPVAASIVNMGWTGNTYYGARRWQSIVEGVRALQRRVPAESWCEVHYEKLLADPPGELARVCAFLGVEYDDAMLRYNADSTYSPPDPANAERWRNRMTRKEIQGAEAAAGELLEAYGYARLFPPQSPGLLRRAAYKLGDQIGRTRFNFNRFGLYLILARKFWRLLGIRRTNLERRFDKIRESHIK